MSIVKAIYGTFCGYTCSSAFTGLFSNHGPLYFVKTKAYFSKMGLVCHIAKIHSEVLTYISLCFSLGIIFIK